MIDRVVGNQRLRAHIRNDIIERTDGIPLFVEEMTKAVLEAGSESAAEDTLPGLHHSGLWSPPACTPRSWRDLTGSARPRRWRRSARRSDANSPTRCWLPWRQAGGRNCDSPSIV